MFSDERPDGVTFEIASEIEELAIQRCQARHDKTPMPRVQTRLSRVPELVAYRVACEQRYDAALKPSRELWNEIHELAGLRARAYVAGSSIPEVPRRFALAPLVALRKSLESEYVKNAMRNRVVQEFRTNDHFPLVPDGPEYDDLRQGVADARVYLQIPVGRTAVARPAAPVPTPQTVASADPWPRSTSKAAPAKPAPPARTAPPSTPARAAAATKWGSEPHQVLALAAAALLVISLADLPYGFYTFLRWVVTLAAGMTVAAALKGGRTAASWPFVAIAILFNPLIPIYLDRTTWVPFDLVAAVALAWGATLSSPETRASQR